MRIRAAIILSVAVGFIGAILILGLPLLIGYGACTIGSWFGLCNTTAFLLAGLEAILVVTGIIAGLGVLAWWIFSKIPSTIIKVGISLLILIVGVLLFQPELDLAGLLALAFSFNYNPLVAKK